MISENFTLNGISYKAHELRGFAKELSLNKDSQLASLGTFLMEWLSEATYIEVKTSGSTGIPKTMRLSKEDMIASARQTIDFFQLPLGTEALLCLPLMFIAGKMMIVRAMVGGWNIDLAKPSTSPLEGNKKNYDFCAMTPMQVSNSVNKLSLIKKLIIGGAPLSQELSNQLKNIPTQSFETYGMTETITHIAVRDVKIESSYFTPLRNVLIDKDERDCLSLRLPYLSEVFLQTNDLVDIKEVKGVRVFKWLGRIDNVINSGGIKLIPEQIEIKLQSVLTFPYFITYLDSEILGQKLVLVVEQEMQDLKLLTENISKKLQPLENPKEIYHNPRFSYLASGKLDKKESMKNAKKLSFT